MKTLHIIIYCGLLFSISAFSIDIMLPAFGAIADSLNAPYSRVQLAIPAFLASMGLGVLFTGSLSDRFGRKPVLLAGLLIFSIGSVVCLTATSSEILVTGRIIQGLGAAGGPVVGRAVLRDLFSGRQLASNLALAAAVFAFGPIVAPLVGAGLMMIGSWRMVFGAILAFGLILLAVGIAALPETNRTPDAKATSPKGLWGNMLVVMGNPQSRYYCLIQGPILILMMIILMAIPRIYREEFAIEGTLFAFLFAIHGIGIIIGQWLNRLFILRKGPQFALMVGG